MSSFADPPVCFNDTPVSFNDTPVSSPPPFLVGFDDPPADFGYNLSSSPNRTSSIAVVGGSVVAVVVVVALLGVFLFCCLRRRRKLRRQPYSSPSKDDPSAPFPQGTLPEVSGGPDYSLPVNSGIPPLSGIPISVSQYSSHVNSVIPSISGNPNSVSRPEDSQPVNPSSPPSIALGFKKNTFTHKEIMEATNGFSDSNILGKGGFGYVYKGTLDRKQVAIKKLIAGGGQGFQEFWEEVNTISGIHHRHLVSLVGYCNDLDQRILVFEYVSNETLHFHLHVNTTPLDWQTRYRIALGAAKGLTYLHEDCHPTIIHRDIKPANILLDSNFDAKVSDFGFAKLQSENYDSHIGASVKGTFGYLAPEYATSHKLTNKSDVYSFGVVILELITGRSPITSDENPEEALIGWAKPLLKAAKQDGNYSSLIDPKLGNNYDKRKMARLLDCGSACIHHSAKRRPKMRNVVRYLEGDISLEALIAGRIPSDSASHEDSAPRSSHSRNLSAINSEADSEELEDDFI